MLVSSNSCQAQAAAVLSSRLRKQKQIPTGNSRCSLHMPRVLEIRNMYSRTMWGTGGMCQAQGALPC